MAAAHAGGTRPRMLVALPGPGSRAVALLALAPLLGCGAGGGAETLRRWEPPPEVLAAGDLQHVEHVEAPAWSGPHCSPCVSPPAPGCSGALQPGAADLAAYLATVFEQIRAVRGYCCRDVCDAHVPPGRMSVHGVGRALDLFLEAGPTTLGSTQGGDEVANWLVLHAASIGIQLVVWNRSVWKGDEPPGSKHGPYGGANGHTDHVHVELSVAGGQRLTAWFGGTGPGP